MVPLDIGASILGGLASSRLDNELVRKDQTAVRVSANLQPFHRLSLFEVQVDVKPGVDADQVAQRLDALIPDFVANGPSQDRSEVHTSELQSLMRQSYAVFGLKQKRSIHHK